MISLRTVRHKCSNHFLSILLPQPPVASLLHSKTIKKWFDDPSRPRGNMNAGYVRYVHACAPECHTSSWLFEPPCGILQHQHTCHHWPLAVQQHKQLDACMFSPVRAQSCWHYTMMQSLSHRPTQMHTAPHSPRASSPSQTHMPLRHTAT